MQIGDGGVYRYFVFPFELDPHGAEFGVSATRRKDVIYDVDVDRV